MRDNFIARLLEHAKEDPRIILITGDLGFKVLDEYSAQVPRQFLNVGVAEQNMTGIAVGMALSGHVAFTYSIGNFPSLRCLEQIRNDACYHGAKVKIVSIGAGFSYGALGFSHHATDDLSILRALPSMTVVSPSCYWEAREATTAVLNWPGTCTLRLDKSSAGDTGRPGEKFEIGKARVLREGSDITLVAGGGILGEVLEAANELATRGIESTVASIHTVKPLDHEFVERAATQTGGIVSVEEHTVVGGLGSAIAESCLDRGLAPKKFRRLGLQDEYSTVVGSQAYLRERFGLDAASIVASVVELLGA